jgi:hypothetical protein
VKAGVQEVEDSPAQVGLEEGEVLHNALAAELGSHEESPDQAA